MAFTVFMTSVVLRDQDCLFILPHPHPQIHTGLGELQCMHLHDVPSSVDRVMASCARKYVNLVCCHTGWDFFLSTLGKPSLVCLFHFTREMDIRQGVSRDLIALLDLFSDLPLGHFNGSGTAESLL